MDLNQLYYDHQLSVIHAGRSGPGGRASFEAVAARAAANISGYQRSLGAPAAGAWERLASHPQPLEPSRADPPLNDSEVLPISSRRWPRP